MRAADWRRTLRRRMAYLLTVKFAALALLWWLFFSPSHRQHIDGDVASKRLAVAPATSVPATEPAAEERSRD